MKPTKVTWIGFLLTLSALAIPTKTIAYNHNSVIAGWIKGSRGGFVNSRRGTFFNNRGGLGWANSSRGRGGFYLKMSNECPR